jgi:hypothetical protein
MFAKINVIKLIDRQIFKFLISGCYHLYILIRILDKKSWNDGIKKVKIDHPP